MAKCEFMAYHLSMEDIQVKELRRNKNEEKINGINSNTFKLFRFS